jgi:hypothetical protein
MRPNDIQGDAVLATLLRELRTYDVSSARAQRLRTRCHSGLTMQHSSSHLPRSREAGAWRAGRVIAGAWCVVYLFETLRRAAAVYGF